MTTYNTLEDALIATLNDTSTVRLEWQLIEVSLGRFSAGGYYWGTTYRQVDQHGNTSANSEPRLDTMESRNAKVIRSYIETRGRIDDDGTGD